MPTKRELEENPEKYAMGIDIQTTRYHPPYSAKKSAETNYREGCKYAKEHNLNKLWVGRSLMQLANLTHKGVFHDAAEMAFKAYNKENKKQKMRLKV
ncbi:MAG: hypothetical protein QXN16_00640 [Candidatus Micrarchaeaceae archaeon]